MLVSGRADMDCSPTEKARVGPRPTLIDGATLFGKQSKQSDIPSPQLHQNAANFISNKIELLIVIETVSTGK